MNMPRLAMPRWPDFGAVFLVLGAVLLALLLGLITAYLPWLFTLLLVLLPLVLLASISRPMVGLVVVMMFIFEVVPSIFQPRVPFGGGRLQAYDLLLIFLSGVVLLRALGARAHPLQAMGPIRWPLYYLLVCMVISFVHVRYFAPNKMMLAEARVAIAWLLVPLIVLAADTPARYRWLLRSVVGIGLVVALYVTIQSLFDLRIMTTARVELLDKDVNSDVVRSIAGGGIYIAIFALFLLINRMLDGRLSWFLGVPGAFLLISGVAVQFGRGVWLATAAGLLVSATLFRGVGGAIRVVVLGVLSLALVIGIASVAKPRLAEALIDRATGIGHEIQSGGSLGWRKLENAAALARIEASPLFGTGMGGEYKQTISLEGSFKTETSYIHNAYLYFPLKMGVLATFIPLAFILAFIVTITQGQARQTGTHADSALVAALCGGFVVPAVTSYTQPEWVSPQGIAAFAVFMALALLYRKMGTPLPERPSRRS